MPGWHLPWFTAAAPEIYDRHGLAVRLIDPLPGPDNVRAAASGQYDLCLTSVGHFLRAKADDHGLGARFVFMVSRRTHMAAFCVEGRPAAHGRPIQRLRDLEGASILGSGDSPFVREYVSFLRHLGLSPGSLIDLPYERVMSALAEGRGDVAADFLDLLPAFEAAAERRAVRVRALPLHASGLEVYGSGLVAGTRMIESRPDAVTKMAAAARDVLVAARNDVGSGLAAMRDMYPGLDEKRAMAGWRAGEPLIFADADGVGTMDDSTWERTIAHHAVTHGTPRVEPAAVYDGSFAASTSP